MKIWEVRDTTDDEKYYTYGFYSTKKKAIDTLDTIQGDINEYDEDFVDSCVVEHELDTDKPEGFGTVVLKKSWEKDYEKGGEWKEVKMETPPK